MVLGDLYSNSFQPLCPGPDIFDTVGTIIQLIDYVFPQPVLCREIIIVPSAFSHWSVIIGTPMEVAQRTK